MAFTDHTADQLYARSVAIGEGLDAWSGHAGDDRGS
jgi:hypothetical protein